MAKERVKLRVSKGGHYIPPEVIERRYELGIKYLFDFILFVDRWRVFENTQAPPVKIAEGERIEKIFNLELWQKLKSV